MLEYHIPKLTRTEDRQPTPNSGRVIDSSKLTARSASKCGRSSSADAQAPPSGSARAAGGHVLEPVGLAVGKLLIVLRVDR